MLALASLLDAHGYICVIVHMCNVCVAILSISCIHSYGICSDSEICLDPQVKHLVPITKSKRILYIGKYIMQWHGTPLSQLPWHLPGCLLYQYITGHMCYCRPLCLYLYMYMYYTLSVVNVEGGEQ